MLTPRRLRLYLDETGDHSSTDLADISKRFLGVAGIIFERPDYEDFAAKLEQFKRKHLEYDPDDPPILHRKEIVLAQGKFDCLREPARRKAFDEDLLQLISAARYRVIMVVLDKVDHWKKPYRRLQHPYHYCLLAMLERYCGWLGLLSLRGDVLAESRGGREDRNLKTAYSSILAVGGGYLSKELCQRTLSSRQIKIKPKTTNLAGLQLADLLAHPLTRDVLRHYRRPSGPEGPFESKIVEIVRPKYNHQIYQGTIDGYGRVFLN